MKKKISGVFLVVVGFIGFMMVWGGAGTVDLGEDTPATLVMIIVGLGLVLLAVLGVYFYKKPPPVIDKNWEEARKALK